MSALSSLSRRCLRPRRVLLVGLVVALLVAPLLGRMHAVLHQPIAAALHGDAARIDGPARPGATAPFAWGNLFGHVAGDATCLVFDQAHSADAAPLPAPTALPLPVALHRLPALHGQAVARWAAQYQARGPPALS